MHRALLKNFPPRQWCSQPTRAFCDRLTIYRSTDRSPTLSPDGELEGSSAGYFLLAFGLVARDEFSDEGVIQFVQHVLLSEIDKTRERGEEGPTAAQSTSVECAVTRLHACHPPFPAPTYPRTTTPDTKRTAHTSSRTHPDCCKHPQMRGKQREQSATGHRCL